MKFGYRDKLVRALFLNKLLGVTTTLFFTLSLLQAGLSYKLYDDFKSVVDARIENTVVKLVPMYSSGPVSVRLDDQIPPAYLKKASIGIAELHENWSWLNIQDRYDEILKVHSSLRYENFLQANLASTGLIDQVKEKHILSTIKIDKQHSSAQFCPKLGLVCAVVTGTRQTFVDYNKPLEEKEVSYFILSRVVMPSESKPSPLHIERLIVIDQGVQTLQRAQDMLERAKNGYLPKS